MQQNAQGSKMMRSTINWCRHCLRQQLQGSKAITEPLADSRLRPLKLVFMAHDDGVAAAAEEATPKRLAIAGLHVANWEQMFS